MKILSLRRRSWLSFLFCFLQHLYSRDSFANGFDLRKLWDIQGPDGKKCLTQAEVDIVPTGGAINSTVCEDSASIARLDYTIHKNAKYPKYQIFQKECKEEFTAGTEPIRGTKSPDEDNKIALSVSPASDDVDTVTASLEILLTEDSLTSSWWRQLTNTEKQQQTIQFCVRMGLWLPPEAGKMEVNFRETNVAVILDKTASGEHGGYVVNGVVLDAKELAQISVQVAGSSTRLQDGQDPSENLVEEKKDEL